MKPTSLFSILILVAALPSCDKPAEQSSQARTSARRAAAAETPAKAQTPADPAAATPESAPQANTGAADKALEQTAGADREQALMSALATMPAATAADYLLAKLPADEFRDRALDQVLTPWTVSNPSEVATWLGKTADFPEKGKAVRRTADLWQRMDLDATIQWALKLPEGSARNNALYPVAAHIRTRPEEQRGECLQGIRDPEARKAVETILKGMAPADNTPR